MRRGTGAPLIGVLALQGNVREHRAMLDRVGAASSSVRTPEDMTGIDGLIIPGGESTTMGRLARTFSVLGPLRERVAAGLPVYGSCAGMIMIADRIVGGVPGQETVGGMDVTVRRNAFGRQVDSFEADLDFPAVGTAPRLHAVFIRAPWVDSVGPEVEVLARVAEGPAAGRIVAVREGALLATSFHPELTSDARVHALFLDIVKEASPHGRALQVGHHQAQEGCRRRQTGQAVRQADQEHRGVRPHRRW